MSYYWDIMETYFRFQHHTITWHSVHQIHVLVHEYTANNNRMSAKGQPAATKGDIWGKAGTFWLFTETETTFCRFKLTLDNQGLLTIHSVNTRRFESFSPSSSSTFQLTCIPGTSMVTSKYERPFPPPGWCVSFEFSSFWIPSPTFSPVR